MYYSSSLLKQFISIDDTTESIANNLILKTCEIEEIIERKISKDVVIGYVKEAKKHPEADKLSVCQVDCGAHGEFQILCGGKNVGADMFVAVAIPGCYLSHIDLKIEKRKLRGLDSNGMICAKTELAINEDADSHGIWILTEDFDDIGTQDIGTALIKKYPRLEARVMDVDNKGITHRPDLTGHFGVATELYAIYKTAAKYGNIKDGKLSIKGETTGDQNNNNIKSDILGNYYKTFADTNILESLESSDKSKKKIETKSDALRSYILMELNDVKVEKSSFFTRLQLLDLGLEPRNNWVDFSNLFLFSYGQPVHFFDADKVKGNIIVRNAKKGEKFVDLFEAEHDLLETDLVIADQEKILALAGVIGGGTSGVDENTKNIVIEIANFDPVVVRKTGTRLGLRTDAELRFEKNINPKFSLYALLFFLDALKYYSKDLGRFEIAGLDYFVADDVKKDFMSPKLVDVDMQEMMKIIFGKEIEGFEAEAEEIITGLGFVKSASQQVAVPLWRGPGDVNIQEDIFEEVARIYGYDRVEPISMTGDTEHIPYYGQVKLQRDIENYLVKNAAFDQLETYPRVDNKLLDLLSVDKDSLYHLRNPLNSDAPCLRNSMRENLLSYTAKNSKFFDTLKIFDIGKVRDKTNKIDDVTKLDIAKLEKNKIDDRYASNYVSERMQMGGILYKKNLSDWFEDTLLEVKDILKNLLSELELTDNLRYKPTKNTNYHPKKQADLYCNDVLIGFVGALHPLVNKGLKIPEHASVTYFSLYFDALEAVLSQNKNKQYSFETLKDQIVWRDLCFVIDQDKDFAILLDELNKFEDISDIDVFDLYKGENLPVGKKSIAFKFKIKGEGNMKTEEINEIMHAVINIVEGMGAKLRD